MTIILLSHYDEVQIMQESMKCPKCRSQLEKGSLGWSGRTALPFTILKKGDFVGDKIIPFYCKNCGYIELFSEKFLRSP